MGYIFVPNVRGGPARPFPSRQVFNRLPGGDWPGPVPFQPVLGFNFGMPLPGLPGSPVRPVGPALPVEHIPLPSRVSRPLGGPMLPQQRSLMPLGGPMKPFYKRWF